MTTWVHPLGTVLSGSQKDGKYVSTHMTFKMTKPEMENRLSNARVKDGVGAGRKWVWSHQGSWKLSCEDRNALCQDYVNGNLLAVTRYDSFPRCHH